MPTDTNRHQTESLLNISKRLNRIDNLDEFLQLIVDTAVELMPCQGSAILLFEEETQQLYYAAVHAERGEQLLKLRIPIDQSIAGQVFHFSRPTNISTNPREGASKQLQPSLIAEDQSLVAVPITFGETTLGVLELGNKSQGGDFTPEDQAAAEILASYAGTAIRQQELLSEAQSVAQGREELKKQKNDFVAIASHELRTPLGLVLGHGTFLKEILDDEFQQEQLEVIVRNAEKLKEIIDSLNQAVNFQSGTASIRWQHIDLNPMMQNLVASFQAEADERQIELVMHLAPERLLIRCDTAKLRVAIGNIIKNALDFSDSGQSVHIGLKKLPGYVRISVTDAGIGIATEDLHRIFQRFYQVEDHLIRKHGGMGLGLSVSKEIVESHGGQIWVESTLGEGSTFTVLLPTKPQALAA